MYYNTIIHKIEAKATNSETLRHFAVAVIVTLGVKRSSGRSQG